MQMLTLRIPQCKSGDYRIELYRWNSGVRDPNPATATLPAADLEGGGLLDVDTVQDFILAEKGASSEFSLLGQHLYDTVCHGDVKTMWEASRPDRVYLAVEDKRAARLPWELMTGPEGLPLFLDSNSIFLRSFKVDLTLGADLPMWPVRVLLVHACNQAQSEQIGADAEVEGIRRQLRAADHSFDVEVLDARREICSPAVICDKIKHFQPQILHFIGHGTVAAAGPALLIWDSQQQDSVAWQAKQIAVGLRSIKHDVRLVYLNACRTQVGVAGRPSAISSIAEAFATARVPAVVAMQADIPASAAHLVADAFYERLAAGDTVDRALVEGRNRIAQNPNLDTDTRNPYLPVLTVNAAPERILQVQSKIENPLRDRIETCSVLKLVRSQFVNRVQDRRQLIEALFCARNGKERSAVVLRGLKGAGKSWLAQWLLGTCAFQRNCVRYVQARHHADWLEMMRSLCRPGDVGNYLTQPLPPKAVAHFYWHLNNIARNLPAPPGDPPARVMDEAGPLTDAIRQDNEAVSKIMQTFLDALEIAASDGSFILVADHWDSSGDHAAAAVTIGDLKTHLWDKIAQNHKSRVKLLLVPPQSSPASEYPETDWKPIDLGDIPGGDMPALLTELYVLLYGEEPNQDEQEALNRIRTPASPARMVQRCEFIRRDIGGKL